MNAKEAIRELSALDPVETRPGVFVYPAEAVDAILGSPDDGLDEYGYAFAAATACAAISEAIAAYEVPTLLSDPERKTDRAAHMHAILKGLWS